MILRRLVHLLFLQVVCFNLFFALRLGTLSPLKSFATEMNVDFQFTIEALSSIDVKKQVLNLTSYYF